MNFFFAFLLMTFAHASPDCAQILSAPSVDNLAERMQRRFPGNHAHEFKILRVYPGKTKLEEPTFEIDQEMMALDHELGRQMDFVEQDDKSEIARLEANFAAHMNELAEEWLEDIGVGFIEVMEDGRHLYYLNPYGVDEISERVFLIEQNLESWIRLEPSDQTARYDERISTLELPITFLLTLDNFRGLLEASQVDIEMRWLSHVDIQKSVDWQAFRDRMVLVEHGATSRYGLAVMGTKDILDGEYALEEIDQVYRAGVEASAYGKDAFQMAVHHDGRVFYSAVFELEPGDGFEVLAEKAQTFVDSLGLKSEGLDFAWYRSHAKASQPLSPDEARFTKDVFSSFNFRSVQGWVVSATPHLEDSLTFEYVLQRPPAQGEN